MNFEELQKAASELRNTLSNYEISEVFGCALNEMNNVDWKNPEKMNLLSPYRQCNYIAALALSVNECENPEPLGKEQWEDICAKVDKIFAYYAKMNFPKNGDFSQMSKEHHDTVRKWVHIVVL